MKVECIDFTEPGDQNCFTHNKQYIVLELYVSISQSKYRIMADFGTPILCSIDKFKVVDHTISKTWIAKDYGQGAILLGPYKWLNNKLWQYSFWEDYFSDDDEKARQVFEEELEKMIAESEL